MLRSCIWPLLAGLMLAACQASAQASAGATATASAAASAGMQTAAKHPPPPKAVPKTPVKYPYPPPPPKASAKTPAPTAEVKEPWRCQPRSYYDSTPVCPPASCNAYHGLYNASKVINPAVNSFSYSGGPNHPPAVRNADDCCSQCRQDVQCNVWNFCSNDAGCDTAGECDYFRSKQPMYPQPNGYGEFGFYCTGSPGKFPSATCILRQAPNGAKVPQTETAAQFGDAAWTSGYIPGRIFTG